MATPRKGQRVRGSRTGRPIMVLLDALGRRWALRVLWELRGAALTFRALQAACGGVSPSVLGLFAREAEEMNMAPPPRRPGFVPDYPALLHREIQRHHIEKARRKGIRRWL